MKRLSTLFFLPLIFSAAALAQPAEAKTLKAVASFTVLADVVQQIGGDKVRVTTLIGPNGDAHQFEATPANARAVKEADVTFISGHGLERWFERLVTASGYQGRPVVVSDGITFRQRERRGQMSEDPHVWNSPLNVLVWVTNIEKALAAADPDDAAVFRANAERYRSELRELDRYAHTKLDPIPQASRKILTSHDAFGYFGRDYGITFMSPLGLSTETEASAARVAQLIDQIKREGIKLYFIENSNDPRLVQQIATATNAHPGGELYAEALSPPDGPAPTYVKMFRHNLDEIAKAFASS
ncbi:metal ABC transporter solute-binding protein, Zn/Mn family (plasmid) [Nitrobacteraceae bacterium UC4446_H13]